ncbi:MAG: bifunctional methionine sulfoxide reductase B/A protein [Chlorobiaceae bacterium]|nr:bifunctional methionine sulfoxide reductase B/A protein [Chlorobiaceae bacterium]
MIWENSVKIIGYLIFVLFFTGCANKPAGQALPKAGLIIQKEDSMKYRALTPDEQRVILDKGTERPFSGQYYLNKEKGVYHCRQCGAELFRSDAKFDSGTGWPSFDDAIPGAVRQEADRDGLRIEIMCATCGGHLGHVFYNEGFTSRNARYCVNSISLSFDPAQTQAPTMAKAVFAGGCFWGVEYHFRKVPGVKETTVGYTGGSTEHPTYEQVCDGRTGHAEAIEVEFDPSVVSYEHLARLFFEIHDPTQVDRQGPDRGTQYRSAVFYHDDQQRKIAEGLIEQLRSHGYDVVTSVEKAGEFWPAELYHQDYYEKSGRRPYCHVYQKRF